MRVKGRITPEANGQDPAGTLARLEQYRSALRVAGTEIERRNKVIRALTVFTHQASTLPEPAALLSLALTQALEITQAQVGAIVLIEPDTKALTMGAHRSLTPELVRILTGQQFDAGAAVLMPHLVTGKGALLEMSDSASEGEALLLQMGQVNSLVSLSIQSGYKLLGALVVGVKEQGRFLPVDIHYLISIAQRTAVALESLQLREKLWHMAETLLGQDTETTPQSLTSWDLNPTLPVLPPLQAQLAEIVTDHDGTMGALFSLDKTDPDWEITLVADYGLSPAFTKVHAFLKLSANLFPFDRLASHNLIVHDVSVANTRRQYPLLASFREEMAKSLMAVYVDDSPHSKIIIVAATELDAFTTENIKRIQQQAHQLFPLITNTPRVPTFPTRNVQVPSMESHATEEDLEQLLEAMMAAEEEVQRHSADLATLNSISELLNLTLNLEQVLGDVLLKIRDLLQTDAVWLYFIDPESHPAQLEMQAHVGLADAYAQHLNVISLGDGLEGRVAKDKLRSVISNTTDEPLRCHMLMELAGIHAVTAVPLTCPDERDPQHHQRVVGVLAAGMIDFHAWRPRQIRLLATIANQMALAVNNAWKYAIVQKGVKTLSFSNQVLQEMNKELLGDWVGRKSKSPVEG